MAPAASAPAMAGFDLPEAKRAVAARFSRKRLLSLAAPVLALAYLAYVAIASTSPGWRSGTARQRGRARRRHLQPQDACDAGQPDRTGRRCPSRARAARPMRKTPGRLGAAERQPRDRRPAGRSPRGDRRRHGAGRRERTGSIAVVEGPTASRSACPRNAALPDFINASPTRVTLTLPDARVTVTRAARK